MKSSIMIVALFGVLTFGACGRKSEATKPIRKDVTELVFTSGNLEAANTFNLTAETDGTLIELYFKEGDILQQGFIAAIIVNNDNLLNNQSAVDLYSIAKSNLLPSSPSILQARYNLGIAAVQKSSDSVKYLRYQELLKRNSISKQEFENIAIQYNNAIKNYNYAIAALDLANQQALQEYINSRNNKDISALQVKKSKLLVQVPGKVYKKFKESGDYVHKGEVIATIGSPDRLYAMVNIDEASIAKIKVGQNALVQLNTHTDKLFKATVAEIMPSFDNSAQAFHCKLVFGEVHELLVNGTQLQANIVVGEKKDALVIPRNYLDYDGTVTIKNGKKKVLVKTNFVGGGWVEIIQGLDEQTEIITYNISENQTKTSELGSQMH